MTPEQGTEVRAQASAGAHKASSSPQREGLTVKQLIQRGMAAWERDDYAGALVDFQAVLRRRPDFPDIRNMAGLCRAMLGDPQGALDELNEAVGLNTEYAEAHLNRAIVLSELGRYDEAKEAFQRAGDLNRGPEGGYSVDLGNRIAVAHARLGDLYLDAEDPKRAASEYEDALQVRPGFLDIRSKLAQALMDLDQVDRACRELEAILEENPDFTGARLRLGVALQRLGRSEDAVSQWQACLEQDPSNRRAHAYLAAAGQGGAS